LAGRPGSAVDSGSGTQSTFPKGNYEAFDRTIKVQCSRGQSPKNRRIHLGPQGLVWVLFNSIGREWMVERGLLSIQFVAPSPMAQRVIRKRMSVTRKDRPSLGQSQKTHKLQYLSCGLVLKNGARTLAGRPGSAVDSGSGTQSTFPKGNYESFDRTIKAQTSWGQSPKNGRIHLGPQGLVWVLFNSIGRDWMVEWDLLSIQFVAPSPMVQRVIRKRMSVTCKDQPSLGQSQKTHKLHRSIEYLDC
jgi:hypothetical protein